MQENRPEVTQQFRPVSLRKTVQDQVYDQLRDALIAGAFEAGESFTIASLSERFQTSHMPVREALRRLAAENALRISTTGTAFVPDITRAELQDITRARLILEGAAAGMAAERMGPGDIVLLEGLIRRHVQSGLGGNTREMVDCNRAFHFHVYEQADSPVLLSLIGNLWLRLGPYVRYLSDRMGDLLQTDYASSFAQHHVEMVAAMSTGDPRAFRAAMERDIRSTADLLVEFMVAGR